MAERRKQWGRKARGGTASAGLRREIELRLLQQLQLVGLGIGNALQENAAELLAGRGHILVDGLYLRLNLADEPRRLLGDDVVVDTETGLTERADGGQSRDFAGTDESIRHVFGEGESRPMPSVIS